MIDCSDALPVTRQAKALGIARSWVYDAPPPVTAEAMKLSAGSRTAFRSPLCGRADAAGTAAARRRRRRPPACLDVDEADGD
jgi:hypothetical protein